MARTLIYTGRWNANRYINNIPKWESRIKDIRDRMRNGLSATEWQVSDIMEWVGSGIYRGCSFVVRSLTGSVPNGKEWMYTFCRPTTTESPTLSWVIGSSSNAVIDDYYHGNNNLTSWTFGTERDVLSAHYNDETRQGTDLFTCEFTATFTGTPTVSETMKQASNEKQVVVIGFVDNGGGNCNIKLRLKRGAKINASDVLVQSPTAATVTIATVVYEALYDFGFDNWDDAEFASKIGASGGAGSFSDSEVVTGGTSAATGVFRRETGGDVYLTSITGTFQVSELITGGTSGTTRDVDSLLLSGDFTNPTSSPVSSRHPYSNLPGFMMKEARLIGITRSIEQQNSTSTDRISHQWFVFDDTKPFVSWHSSLHKNIATNNMILQGAVVIPNLTGDTNGNASLYWNTKTDEDEVGTTVQFRMYAYRGDYLPGSVATWSILRNNLFTLDNTPRKSDGLYSWDIITIINADEFKGYLDTAVIRQAGTEDHHSGLVLSGPDGPFVKHEHGAVWPWVTGEAAIHAPRWNQEPDSTIF